MIEITVGFPVYKVEKYVRRSLLSVLEQDFSLPFEILVVDDRGGDASMDIVRELAASHPNGSRIRILENERNQGLMFTRNKIIDNAAGRYLYFLDSDDAVSPDALSSLHKFAEKYNAEVTFGNDMEVKDGVSKITCKYDQEIFLEGPGVGQELFVKYYFSRDTPWNRLFSTEFLRRNNIRCLIETHEDVLLNFFTRLKATRVAYCPKVTYYYLVRTGSEISKCSDRVYQDITTNLRYFVEAVEDSVSKPDVPRFFYQFCWLSACGAITWFRRLGLDEKSADELLPRLVSAMPADTVFRSKSTDKIFKAMKNHPEKATCERFYGLKEFYKTLPGHIISGIYAAFHTRKARRRLYYS